MKRIIGITICLMTLLSICIKINAYTDKDNKEAIETFKAFIDYYNVGNEELLNIIDGNNTELYSSFKKELGKGKVNYDDKISTQKTENGYKIAALMSGSGKIYNSRWYVNNKYILFTFKHANDKYLLIDTDFFTATGINILKTEYKKLFTKSITIAFLMFIIILVVIYIVVKILNIKEARKRLKRYKLEQMNLLNNQIKM